MKSLTYLSLIIFFISISDKMLAQNSSLFSKSLQITMSAPSGVGFNIGSVNDDGFSVQLGISFVGKIPKGEDYTATLSPNRYTEDIERTFRNKLFLDLKLGKEFESLLTPYFIVSIGTDYEVQERYDDLEILSTNGRYYLTTDDKFVPNLGIGFHQVVENNIIVGIESSLERPISFVFGMDIR